MRRQAISPIPLYLHIPKCGGSTVTSIIYQQCRLSASDVEKKKYWHRGIYFYPAGLFSSPSAPSNADVAAMLDRKDLTAVVGHFSFGIHRHVRNPSTYVTLLRNPVSRTLSLYDELRAQSRIKSTLHEFVVNPPTPATHNDQTRRIAGTDSTQDEKMLQTAKLNLANHFILTGLTERMDETLCLMHRLFGWENYCFYYPKNVTTRRTDSSSISPDLLDLIKEQNKLDMRLYAFAEERLRDAMDSIGPGFQSKLQEYKESVKKFVAQTDLNKMENEEEKKVHRIVLEMIDKGNVR